MKNELCKIDGCKRRKTGLTTHSRKASKDNVCYVHWKSLFAHNFTHPNNSPEQKRTCQACGIQEESYSSLSFDKCPNKFNAKAFITQKTKIGLLTASFDGENLRITGNFKGNLTEAENLIKSISSFIQKAKENSK